MRMGRLAVLLLPDIAAEFDLLALK